jgi:signal peptidase II
MKRSYMLFASVVVVGVVVDQATKVWADAALRGRGFVHIIDGYFDLFLSHNRGAFFSLGQSLPDSVRAGFFICASLVAVALMLQLFRRTAVTQKALRWALMLLCAGAAGNMIDRARRGEVTDFLHLHLREVFHWATFNVADILITAGLLLLLVDLVRSRERTAA